MENASEKTFSFGDFELSGAKRSLLKQGASVALNSKTFDLLLALVENPGQIVSKDELLEKVWEGQFVEENNLTVQIAALRKLLGEKKGEHQFIATIPGKGYKFIGELNNESNGEIVIENHSFSRVVIDEEIEERGRRRSDRLKPNRLRLAGLVFLIAVFGIGGYLWQSAKGKQNAAPFQQISIKQLTTNGKVSIAALSPDGKLFAYVTSDLGERSLWLGYVEGGNHLQLRPVADTVYHELAFSPDSNELYFSLRDEKNPKSALYKMPVSGGAAQKIADEMSNFRLSPDGRQIAFARYDAEANKNSLLVSNLDGSEKREIASFSRTTSFVFNSIAWSSDGTHLAFGGSQNAEHLKDDVFVVELANGEIRQVTTDRWQEITNLRWLADGTGFIVTALAGEGWSSVEHFQIWQVSYPGGEIREITRDRSSYGSSLSLSAANDAVLSVEHRQLNNIWIAPVNDLTDARQITFGAFGKYDGLWGLDWTPDGKLIYTNSDTSSAMISQLNADGSGEKPLTAPGKVDSVLMVSPDGRYVVFHSNRTGGFDIWRMDVDGTNPVRLTDGRQSYQPFISADSRWVYYKSWLTEKGELRRVSIDGGEPEVLNDHETSWGSASPDGKFFAASYVTDKQRLAIFSAATNQIVKQFEMPKTATLFMGSHWTPDSRAVVYRDNAYGYWRQSIDGGEPQRLEGLPKEKFYNFAFSKDGKSFAFVRGTELRDVVLISNAER